MPFLLYPLALLALASVPALAAIYILRNRYRRRQVSSLLLWRFTVQSKEGGAKVHRLQLPLLFFLELLALLLLVIAAAAPSWKLPQSARPLIIVLDDSFSLRAVTEGQSAQQRAQDFLEKLFRRSPPPSTRLILAGAEPRLLGGNIKSLAELHEPLRGWQCWSPDADLDAALTLAAELAQHQANILVLTDHKPAEEKITNPRLEWHAFGTPEPNLALVNATRTALGEDDRCLLEVANCSAQPRSTTLRVSTGTNVLQASRVTFAPRERQRFVFSLPAAAPALDVKLDSDALAADDTVQLLPPLRRRVRVQVALGDTNLHRLAERTLAATGLRAAISADPELVIHDLAAPALGSNAWSLRWVAATQPTALTGPFIVDNSHPLAEGLTLAGVVWAAGALTNAPGETAVLLAGNTPLLSAREDFSGRRLFTLNFAPALSTLTATPDWPVLFCNLLQWRAAETPGLHERNARLGAEVLVRPAGAAVSVTQPDGAVKSFPHPADRLALETPLPGIYSVTLGTTTNQFAVNALAPDESDLTANVTGKWGAWSEATEQRLVEASLVWLFALAALALLVTHLWLIATQRGGAR